MKTVVESANKTDVGRVRTINEDYLGRYEFAFGELIIVCDGMGGHEGGEIASRIAVQTIKEHFDLFDPKRQSPQEELRLAIESANHAIIGKAEENPSLKGMGSTVVIFLRIADEAYVAHMGDSRVYMIRKNAIHQITTDHSLVQQMIDAKMITAEEAKTHPQKNVIKKALGVISKPEPDIQSAIRLFRGDMFVLCSDGLTGFVEDAEIMDSALKYSPRDACDVLVGMANQRGGTDNITLQIVRIVKGKKFPRNIFLKLKKYAKYAAIIIAALALLASIYFAFQFMDNFDFSRFELKGSQSQSSEKTKETKEKEQDNEPKKKTNEKDSDDGEQPKPPQKK